MHIRRFELDDISATASIIAECFWDDELFNFTNPFKAQFPDHYRDYFVRRVRLRHWSPGFAQYVAVTDAGDDGHEDGGRITGYAVWERTGTNVEAQSWYKRNMQSYIECRLLSLQDSYIAYLHLDQSQSPTNRNKWLSAISQDPFKSLPEVLHLRGLCVSPSFQRQGIGAMLMAWGKELAEREQYPIGLTSSMKGKGLYEKQGFRRIGTLRVEGFPVDDVPMFLWEPEGIKGSCGILGDTKIHP